VAPPPAAPSPGDTLVARIEDSLTRGDAAAARASLDELQRVDARHPRGELLATLVARAEETRRLAKAPPRPDTPARTDMATTSIAPGATLPVARDDTADGASTAPAGAPPAPDEVAPVAAPVAAPDTTTEAAPSTVARNAVTPVASPTDLRPSKLTAVSFAGRTVEDSTAPPVAPAPVPAPTRTAPDRPKAVVMDMKLLRSVPPDYPEDARRRKLEGSVDLAFVVGADGKVKDVEVAQSTAPGVFDAEAIAAVKRWRYDPRREDGVPVDYPAKVRLEFKLDK
jgi:protein TonB